ncbi:hypothetical protein [Caldivirga sp. UBA161]|uniref:hypothetical protein n=1 Tax=Caldivirga sp. UBA161 TaxID=1915569 RepID=UPI0025C64B21|nr:hypothetical protein [Caldivirga sp. UBA161]
MRSVRYVVLAATLATVLTILVVMAQPQNSTTQPTVNSQNATSTTHIMNCAQYGEFQGEFQCGEQVSVQVNVTAHNVTEISNGDLDLNYESIGMNYSEINIHPLINDLD